MRDAGERVIGVRIAARDDVPAIAGIHVRAWQRAYRGIMPDDFLDALAPEQRYARWEADVSAPDGAMTVIVAEDRLTGRLLGFCSVCPQRHLTPGDAAQPPAAELYTMYVDGDKLGRGIGRRLMAAAEERMRAMGFIRGVLWMLADNAPARAFYERMGWRPDGETRSVRYGDRLVAEMRLAKALREEETP